MEDATASRAAKRARTKGKGKSSNGGDPTSVEADEVHLFVHFFSVAQYVGTSWHLCCSVLHMKSIHLAVVFNQYFFALHFLWCKFESAVYYHVKYEKRCLVFLVFVL